MRCAVGSVSIQSSSSWRRGVDAGDWARAGTAPPSSAPSAVEPMPKRDRKRRLEFMVTAVS
jgi:hypothetical protein